MGRRCRCLFAAFALLFFAAAYVTARCADGTDQEGEEARRLGWPERERLRRERGGAAPPAAASRRRLLVGPGSSPPSCRERCGRCSPCRPVRVAIHPAGRIVPQEYYPEAWRCKCGDQLFMP